MRPQRVSEHPSRRPEQLCLGGRDNLLSRLRSSKSLLAEVHIWLKRSDARARHLLSLRDPDNKLSGPP